MANKFGHVNPWWDVEQIKNLKFKLDTLKDTNLVQKYLSAGHSKDHVAIWNYFEPNPMPGDISIFYDYFPELKNSNKQTCTWYVLACTPRFLPTL